MIFVDLEPDYARAMTELQTAVRVRAEGLGITSKTVVTFCVLLLSYLSGQNQGEYALLAFAMGQFVNSVVVLLVYLYYFRQSSFWLRRITPARETLSVRTTDFNTGMALTSQT